MSRVTKTSAPASFGRSDLHAKASSKIPFGSFAGSATRVLDLTIEDKTWAAMVELAPSVASVNKMRMQEEIWKFLLRPGTDRIFRIFAELGIFAMLFSELIPFLDPKSPSRIWEYLAAKDEVPKKELTQTLALGVLLLPFLDEVEGLGLENLEAEVKRLATRCRETIESMGRLYSVARETRYGVIAILEVQLYLVRGPDGVRASKRSEGGRRSPVDSPYFEQALILFRVLCKARGSDGALIRAWEEEARRRRANPPRHRLAPVRKQRRRRRSSRLAARSPLSSVNLWISELFLRLSSWWLFCSRVSCS